MRDPGPLFEIRIQNPRAMEIRKNRGQLLSAKPVGVWDPPPESHRAFENTRIFVFLGVVEPNPFVGPEPWWRMVKMPNSEISVHRR